jgi:hypothetical protein
MAEMGNLLENNISNGYYDQRCVIDGEMFLIFMRICRISLFFYTVHIGSYVASCEASKGASN